MKKIIFFLAVLTFMVSCSDDDKVITASNTDLSFTAEGGEQSVDVVSDGAWSYDCSEDWVLVRQRQGGIRVIVSPNPTESVRKSFVRLLVNGDEEMSISIEQEGLKLGAERYDYEVQHLGDALSIPINCNSDWEIDAAPEWLTAQKVGENLKLEVTRNYQMQERSSQIVIHVGTLSKTFNIKQLESPWFDSFEMVEVPAGTFYMGAQKDEPEGKNFDASSFYIESPVHFVNLDSYYIGKFEITQAQWTAAMGYNPSAIIGDDLPVENVSWNQVQEFIGLLNSQSGKNYRLPTEAEWEYAATGGSSSSGFKFSGFSVLGACGWFYSNSEASTHPIGSKYANELDIYDMSGNVREWCDDWFDYYSSNDEYNPKGPVTGQMKVNRGGSWTSPAVNCRNTFRNSNMPDEAAADLGFRLVLAEN